MKKILLFLSMAAVVLTFTACNSNDNNGVQDIEIPGVTLDGDVDCCSAEEALQVYKFLQTVTIIPELSIKDIDDKYNVFAYRSADFHRGYNEIFFVATKKKNGNYVKDFDITSITPLMHMSAMNMYHSTPISAGVETFDNKPTAVKRGWISFIMATSGKNTWALSYTARVLKSEASINDVEQVVNPLPDGQDWVKSFKVGDETFFISLVNPTEYKTGTNAVKAYISKKSAKITEPYQLANEKFTVEIVPTMPDMGNHSSPDNEAFAKQSDGSYLGTLNLTMTGLWRIHLTVKDANGNIVAGGDDLDSGFSSLYLDVTI